MTKAFYLYNTLTRKKEIFEPINPPHVGLYVCGPTVYGDPHLGHARPAVTFDILFRYLKHLGYKVRYVRNITDVGHLEDEVAGEGEDKIQKKARLEKLEPMEVVQYYTNRYHHYVGLMNIEPPSIEPHASGHILEQQQMVKQILQKGFAYEVNGSVYFDLEKFNKQYGYGALSGRVVEDMISNTRALEGGEEKRFPLDFALWKKADDAHIMRWPSEWGDGYPGWHIECSVMGKKYLGMTFDIHGGGMDLVFPHHECEIAQTVAVTGKQPVRYWIHNNMITINGQKMSKSKNNFITLEEVFTGDNQLLEQAFSPITVRFYMLQAHYTSPLDFSNEALKAAEQGLARLMKGMQILEKLQPSADSTVDVGAIEEKAYEAMNDDMNCPVLLSHLFEGTRIINAVRDGHEKINAEDLKSLRSFMKTFTYDILGLKTEEAGSGLLDQIMEMLLQLRKEAKDRKDFAVSDQIRDKLLALGVKVKDTKDGFEWEFE